MKKRKFNIVMLTFLMSLCACNESMKESESQSSEISSESSILDSSSEEISSSSSEEISSSSSESSSSSIKSSSEEISSSIESIDVDAGNEKEISLNGYDWSVKEDDANNDNYSFSISSTNANEKFKTFIDGKLIEETKDNKLNATLVYELDPDYPCSTDSVEHAQNVIKLNGNKVGLLHNDLSLTCDFDIDDFKVGENVLSLTIGYVYSYESFHEREVLYKPGWGDDFKLRNLGIKLSNGEVIMPKRLRGWYCNETFTELVAQDMDVSDGEYYWIGDGWGATDTYFSFIGHSDPKYVRPVIIEYYFDYSPKLSSANYEINTKDYGNGKHTITSKVDDLVVKQNNVIFDNDLPSIDINVKDDATITSKYKFASEVSDDTSGIASSTVKVDGNVIVNNDYSSLKLVNGNHNISVSATDNAGNTNSISKSFNVSDNASNLTISVVNNKQVVNKEYDSTYTFKEYSATSLNINANDCDLSSSTEMVYDEFEVNVKDNSLLYIVYNGQTEENEKLVFKAYNQVSSQYDDLYVANNGEIKFRFDPTNYVNDGKVNIKVYPYKVDNGSNKIIWASDTQYLPKAESNFADINDYYNQLMEYIKDEYLANNIAYLIHTGDIVDDNPTYKEQAIKEWKNADEAFKILDDASVPYGTCAGNHDVGSSIATLDYSYYSSFFGVERTGNSNYYGGSLNNNECHYDLISIGNYDFVILYLGYGKEVNDESLAFANSVLSKYKNRNAIIATHAYLDNGGEIDVNTRGEEIYNKIVVPNENVKLVLCGHTDGSEVVKKSIGDRVVFELLSCYQFVETTTDAYDIESTNHVINGLKCNGEGFIKSLTFKDDKLIAKTFSPVLNVNKLNSNNGINYATNDYTIKLDLKERVNVIKRNSVSAYQVDKQVNKVSTSSGKYSMSSGNFVLVEDATGAYGFNIN